jgi:predicted PhzF superfamily epimerase YddE/YHI9
MDHNQHRFTPVGVFATSSLVGTEASISLCRLPVTVPLMQQSIDRAVASGAVRSAAFCFLWPEQSDSGAVCFRLSCFNQTQAIQCCGHGLLAAANYLKPHRPEYLLTGGGSIPVQYYPHTAVGLPRIQCQPIDNPDWLAQVFDQLPLSAAIAGGEQGYLLLRYDGGSSLSSLRVQFANIQQFTQRAVIVTQWLGRHDVDYGLRYFAPQYGIDEDVVTGSAQRVLADFWQQYQPQDDYIVRQFSPLGGLLRVAVEERCIYLSEVA